MKDISSVLLTISIIMAGLVSVVGLVVVIVHIVYGPEAGREVLRMMLLC